jgi:hypothetical protein
VRGMPSSSATWLRRWNNRSDKNCYELSELRSVGFVAKSVRARMIASFCYTVRPKENCVAVDMTWGRDGSRQGTSVVPRFFLDQIGRERMPATHQPLSIDGAIPYAVVLAVRADLPLTLTGDISVWREQWGGLIRQH